MALIFLLQPQDDCSGVISSGLKMPILCGCRRTRQGPDLSSKRLVRAPCAWKLRPPTVRRRGIVGPFIVNFVTSPSTANRTQEVMSNMCATVQAVRVQLDPYSPNIQRTVSNAYTKKKIMSQQKASASNCMAAAPSPSSERRKLIIRPQRAIPDISRCCPPTEGLRRCRAVEHYSGAARTAAFLCGKVSPQQSSEFRNRKVDES